MLTPIRPKGPPLNALRAFEAAARLGGFSAAANELCVTAGAVTQHIKALESWVGAPLFVRRSQGVELTPLGDSVLSDFSAAFDQLGEAVLKLRAGAAPKTIRIAALPSVAQLWLSPRLPAIHAVAPNIAVSVTAMEWPPNLLREPFDLSIFYTGINNDTESVSVCRDEIFPVCAPSLAPQLKVPDDIAKLPLLQDSRWATDWQLWLKQVAPDSRINLEGPTFSLYSLAIEEAINGAGVLMAHSALVEEQLASGKLVAPFSQRVVLDKVLSVSRAQHAVTIPVIEQIVAVLVR